MSNYFIHYDKKTGQVHAVTLGPSDNYQHSVPIDQETAQEFIQGKRRFIDHFVDHVSSERAKFAVLVDRYNQGQGFDRKIFSHIEPIQKGIPNCLVEWTKKGWQFSLSKSTKNTIKETWKNSRTIFYITLDTDLDFLIRTIVLEIDDLIKGKITVPFVEEIERDLSKISISTRLIFKTYGLKINDKD